MTIPSKNADLYRRLRFYGFGFLLGLLVVAILFRGRSCKTPASAKLEELSHQSLVLTEHGECRMKCRGITEAEIKEVLNTGKINYDKSKVHDSPCGTYAVEGKTTGGQSLRIIIADCDTT